MSTYITILIVLVALLLAGLMLLVWLASYIRQTLCEMEAYANSVKEDTREALNKAEFIAGLIKQEQIKAVMPYPIKEED